MQERYPELEADIADLMNSYVRSVAEVHSPMTGEIHSYVIHEGRRSILRREDGSEDETNMQTHSADCEISQITVLYGTHDQIFEAFTPIGLSMASQKEKMLFEAIREATDKTGNIIDAKGKPLSFDLLMELLEKMPIDFDKDGQAIMPTLAVGPDMEDKIKKIAKKCETKENIERHTRLMQKKKDEWRAREADRILVG